MITLSITSAGIPWSTADLARITPDPEAPLCSVQQQLEALGYRSRTDHGAYDGMCWLRDRDFRLGSHVLNFDPVYRLVHAAFNRAYQSECTKLVSGWQDWTAQMAEAEALLRTGWTP